MSYVENTLTGFPKMKELLSILARSFSSSVPSFSTASTCFFAKRFFSGVSYHSSTSSFAHPIPKLPIIDSMVEKAASLQLPAPDRTAFICMQHILETTATILKGLVDIGIKPENIFCSGKSYSTAPEVAAAIGDLGIQLIPATNHKIIGQYQQACREGLSSMWQQFAESIRTKTIERIIVLDDGGRLLEAMPSFLKYDYKIAGIEQTRGGLYSPSLIQLPFPLVEVASSAVKRMVEPPLIMEAVLNRIRPMITKLRATREKMIFGVIGNGAIGSAIVNYLLSEGVKVVVYDENDKSFHSNRGHKNARFLYQADSPARVIANSDCIFGCTGRDVTRNVDTFGFNADKVFISCTSEDREFLSLLQKIGSISQESFSPLEDILFTTESGCKILVVAGGFPVNFDRTPYSVLSHDIEITRALLFGASLQAMRCASTPAPISSNGSMRGNRLCLNPYIQRYVATMWGSRQPATRYPAGFFAQFHDLDFVIAKSGGIHQPDSLLRQSFMATYKGEEAVQITPSPKV